MFIKRTLPLYTLSQGRHGEITLLQIGISRPLPPAARRRSAEVEAPPAPTTHADHAQAGTGTQAQAHTAERGAEGSSGGGGQAQGGMDVRDKHLGKGISTGTNTAGKIIGRSAAAIENSQEAAAVRLEEGQGGQENKKQEEEEAEEREEGELSDDESDSDNLDNYRSLRTPLPPRQDNSALAVYLIDVAVLGTLAFSQGLREVLQSETVPKLFFDCRRDSDALFHQFQVRLAGMWSVFRTSMISAFGK